MTVAVFGLILAVVAIALALSVLRRDLRWCREQYREQDRLYWKTLVMLAETEHIYKRHHHDMSDEHVWLEVTTYGDSERYYRCAYCVETKTEPFEAVMWAS